MGNTSKIAGLGGLIFAAVVGIVIIALLFSSFSKLQSNECKF